MKSRHHGVWLALGALLLTSCGGEEPSGFAYRDVPGPGDDVSDEAPDDEVPDDEVPDGGEVSDPEPDADMGEDPPEDDVEPSPQCPEGWRDQAPDQAPELFTGLPFGAPLAGCGALGLHMVAAAEVGLQLSLTGLPAGATVEVTDARGEVLGSGMSQDGVASVGFVTVRPGAVRAVILRDAPGFDVEVRGVLECKANCEREATRYPIVLFHGMAGTDNYFGILEYYYNVPGFLAEHGFQAFTPVTHFIGHSEDRAERLADQLNEIMAETGAEKIHMIAHSQGGLDIRVLVSGMGFDRHTASMTTIATPHNGVPVDLPEFLTGMNFQRGYLTDEFNRRYPNIESIPRFSWAGRTCALLEPGCREDMNGELVTPVLAASYRLIQFAARNDGFGGANDGVVTVESSIWGEFLGTLPTDHFDEVGQIADEREGPFDHLQFYLDEARRLRRLEIDRREGP